MTFRSGFLVLAVVVSACGSREVETPEMGLPAWDGDHIVCNEDVSFAAGAVGTLPEFTEDDRLGFCARSMRYIELHREFGSKTSYFGVVAATTASLAATYAPLVRKAYSESTWTFMADMNRELEAHVNEVAQKAGQGGLSGILRGGLDTGANVRAEQETVQAKLDAFAASDPEGYAQLIEDVNGTFNPTNRLLIAAINRNPFFKAYEAGLAQVRVRHGGAIDFADIEQRVEIGAVLQALIEGTGE